ncbi:MAG: hypothetical protein K6C36_03425 [Clostridia bacterium]|nr:hypothetical protein [Clostridia bacterium]
MVVSAVGEKTGVDARDFEYTKQYSLINAEVAGTVDEAELIASDLLLLGFAESVSVDDSSDVYIGEKTDGTIFLKIYIAEPHAENFEKTNGYLKKQASVTVIYDDYATVATPCGVTDYRYLSVQFDTKLQSGDAAISELLEIDGVHSVKNVSGSGSEIQSLEVWIEYPFYINGPVALGVILEKPYILAAEPDWFAGGTIYHYGDVIFDHVVTAGDAREVLRYSLELEIPDTYLKYALADIDCDGTVTAADARLTLRTALGFNPLNIYEEYPLRYQGLIAGKSVGLAKDGGKLVMTASTVGSARVTRCGFNYVKLQRLADGLWTDVPGYVFTELYGDSSSKVFSKAAEVGHGTYRVVCEHYAETPSAYYTVQSAVFYEASEAVTI